MAETVPPAGLLNHHLREGRLKVRSLINIERALAEGRLHWENGPDVHAALADLGDSALVHYAVVAEWAA